MEPSDRSWGITPVPDRLRTLSLLDVGLLWGNLGVSLLVLFTGTFLAGLGLQRALLATVVGAVLGTALLGLAGLIGFERRLPGMVLMRDPLGHRGSYAPTGLNVAQNLGWAVFELYVMSLAASALTDQLFGFEARWAWVLVFGALTAWLALAGPISFVRRYVRRFAVWAVAASLAYLVWWALDGADAGGLWSAPGEGGITFWQGVDLTIAMAASWLPLAADYTRFSRSRRAAFWGTSAGYFVPLVLLYGLGVLLALSRGLAEPSAIFTAIAAGGAASALALLALTVDESDEPFANVYSAAVSLQNVVPWASQRLLVVLVAGTADARRRRRRHPRLRDVPAPARLLLRAALRRPRGRLPAGRRAAGGRALERDRRLGGRIRPLPVDPPDRARRGGSTRPREFRVPETRPSARRCRRSRSPSPSTQAYAPRMRHLGVVGLVSLDRVDGGIPRLGGVPVYAARALRLLGAPAVMATKIADEDRPRLSVLGVPGGRAPGHADDRVPHRERRQHAAHGDRPARGSVHPRGRERLALEGARRRRLGARGGADTRRLPR